MKTRRISIVVLSVLLCFLWPANVSTAAPDVILHNAKVVTVNDRFSIVQALAVENGRIIGAGSSEEILKLKGPQTQSIDLQGKMVLPGLIDSHVHAAAACMTEFDHEIPTLETIPDVLAYIERRAKELPEGQWIEVRQVFITRLKEQRYPTRAELDRAAPKHPLVFQTGPDASVNSLALKMSGIDRDFKVMDGGSGFIEKDAEGQPTGILRNASRFLKIASAGKKASSEDRERRLAELFKDYNSVGITAVCDRAANTSGIETYSALRSANKLTVRVRLSHDVPSIGALADIEANIRRISEHALAKTNDQWLRIIGVKTFLDGGMLTGSAFMREPWGVSSIYGITDPDYRGVRFIPRDRLEAMVRTAAKAGLQFTAHSVGDGAVHGLLEVYEALSKEMDLRKTRPCISHSNFMSREAVEMAARLGVFMDIQPAWLYHDTRTLAKHFGYDRLRYFQPLKSIFEAGGITGGGSDHMQKIGSFRSVNIYNPFLGMATTVGRIGRDYKRPLHPEEALNREQMIRFYTINNAKMLLMDDFTGSIEPGKQADIIVLDTDLLTCPPQKIADTKVLRAYVSGKLVHQQN